MISAGVLGVFDAMCVIGRVVLAIDVVVAGKVGMTALLEGFQPPLEVPIRPTGGPLPEDTEEVTTGVGIFRVLFVLSKIDSSPSVNRERYMSVPMAAMLAGALPTATVAVTVWLVVLMTETVPSLKFST